jgi:hypothetical protein
MISSIKVVKPNDTTNLDETNPKENEFLPSSQAMHHDWRRLFFTSFVPSLFATQQFVTGGRVPSRTSLIGQDVSQDTVEVPGLNYFVEYVCPNAANVKRNTVAVPINQLVTVLQKLQQMEEDILILINQFNIEGQLDSTDPSGVFVGENGEEVVSISNSSPASMSSASLSSAVAPVSPAISSAALNVSGPGAVSSTTILESTVSGTEAVATVTGEPNNTNVAADSTAMGSGSPAAPTTLSTVAASCTRKTPEFGSAASSTNLTDYTVSPSSTSISAETTSGSGGAAAYTGVSSLVFSDANSTSLTYPAASPSSTSISAGTASGSGAPASSTGYTFNAQSSKNVAVYFGQTAATGQTTLALQCADPSIDIVILAFLIATSDGGQYPQVNFGAACGGQTSEMISEAPGLLSCPQLAADITTCQTQYGKKVLLSIGGATGQISFPTATSASTFATTVWNLFGPPGNVDIGLRPFGTVELDGFDVGKHYYLLLCTT